MSFEPINYSTDVQTPFQAAAQGYQLGAGIRDDQFKQQQQQVELQQQQQARAQQMQLQQDLAAASRDHTLLPGIMVRNPQIAEKLKFGMDASNTQQAQGVLSEATPIYSAFMSGPGGVDIGINMLKQRAAAQENSGDKQGAAATLAMADQAAQDPQGVAYRLAARLATVPGGDKVIDGVMKQRQEQRAQDQAPAALRAANADATTKEGTAKYALVQSGANARLTTAQADKTGAEAAVAPQMAQAELKLKDAQVRDIFSQITNRVAQFGLANDVQRSEIQIKAQELAQKFGQLPDDARKLVNDSAVQGVTSEMQTKQYNDLSGKLDQIGDSWGAGSTAHEWLKRTTGNEDAVSAFKREYTRMASQGVIKLLPPGPASDKDIANAKEGIPNANASPQVMASYLRGMAKLSAYDAALNQAKADWVGQSQTLGSARMDMTVGDTKVPKGTTFADFARQFMARNADTINSATTVQGRSYMRFANPAAPPAGGLGTGTYGAQ
jgi:hypothetical protein